MFAFFPYYIKKSTDKNIQNCDFASCTLWVRNLVSHFEGGTYTEVFENRALKGIFGPRREEDGSWRKLHNDELNGLYSSPSTVRVIKSRRMRWEGHVARMEEERGVYRALVGRPEGERPLGKPRRRREDNIKMNTLGRYGSMW
jgi:hypothetical protein